MTNTITINTDMLGIDFIDNIKKLFPHKTVDIIIQPSDETEYILSNPQFAKELKQRIADFDNRKEVIILNPDELI